MRKFLFPIIVAAIVFLPMIFLHSCANTTQAPTGGPKDTIPPVIVAFRPENGATGVPVHGTKFAFTFNEYVTVKTASNIFLSPPQAKIPKSKVREKTLNVSFEEDLLPNTTYTINFTDAVADANEGNTFPGFTYVFSTGERIDSMFLTGTVVDCKKLEPVKGATVMLYKNPSDSAIFKEFPVSAVKTDDWGYFCLPYLQDTVYRLYAILDKDNNNKYDKESDQIAFMDNEVRPEHKIIDTLPELQKYDMKDTLLCKARKSDHTLILFREKPDQQYVVNKVRPEPRSAYVTFHAPNAWIDSLWIAGYPANRVITQFNRQQDSLEIWVNDRRPAPDSLHLFLAYRKTDSLNTLHAHLEHIPLVMYDKEGKPIIKATTRGKKKQKPSHEDTLCVFKMTASPETIEQNGFQIEFKNPIIEQNFNKMKFTYVNPRQKEFDAEFTVERDSTNLRCYTIWPKQKLMPGNEYKLHIPYHCFRDITGFYSDSLDTKIMLPTDDNLTTLNLECINVNHKYIVELMSERMDMVLRTYVIKGPTSLAFPYLKEGNYAIRLTSDENENSMVDTGSLLEHRQPEKVVFYENDKGEKFIKVPAKSEVSQDIDFAVLFSERK